MHDPPAYRRLHAIARKWQALSERRRVHFGDLYRSGRWRKYYSEEEFLARARDVAGICERWTHIIEVVLGPPAEAPSAATVDATPGPSQAGHRDAA